MNNQALYSGMNNNKLTHSHSLLSKFTSTWEKRSQIKNRSFLVDLPYEIEKPDFLEELIPIKNCATYQSLSDNKKNSILSYAWIAYNAKTIAIESKLISPICYNIIEGNVPGIEDNESRQVIAETLTDESYHILICHHAIAMTEKIEKLPDVYLLISTLLLKSKN